MNEQVVIRIIRHDEGSGQAEDEIETFLGALKVFVDVQNKHSVFATFEVVGNE